MENLSCINFLHISLVFLAIIALVKTLKCYLPMRQMLALAYSTSFCFPYVNCKRNLFIPACINLMPSGFGQEIAIPAHLECVKQKTTVLVWVKNHARDMPTGFNPSPQFSQATFRINKQQTVSWSTTFFESRYFKNSVMHLMGHSFSSSDRYFLPHFCYQFLFHYMTKNLGFFKLPF